LPIVVVHAFVDESQRSARYYIAAAVLGPDHLKASRQRMRGLLLPNQPEIHFNREKPARQRALVDAVARMPVEVLVYHGACGRHSEPTRQKCLARLVADLLDRRAHQLVIDSREERDLHDRHTLYRIGGNHPHGHALAHRHCPSTSEALLWIPDIAGWYFGAGGDWRRRIEPIIKESIDIDQL
jgi:hypothetical protein